MPEGSQKTSRLPRNFHRTFVPERQYIGAMLHYAASGNSGDYQEISSATGIPTGESSGKVPAILDYCRGMGLVVLGSGVRSAVKLPRLTPFGRAVLLEDPHLKEPLTQCLCHLNLCGVLTGADVWYQTFCGGSQALGMSFRRQKLEEYLELVYGTRRAGLIGPLVRMYEDQAAFSLCGALREEDGTICKRPAPLDLQYARGYGAWLLNLVADHCPGSGQVSLPELDALAGWRTIPCWGIDEGQYVLEMIERKDLVSVDRHMDPWLLQPKALPDEAWSRLYDDLI